MLTTRRGTSPDNFHDQSHCPRESESARGSPRRYKPQNNRIARRSARNPRRAPRRPNSIFTILLCLNVSQIKFTTVPAAEQTDQPPLFSTAAAKSRTKMMSCLTQSYSIAKRLLAKVFDVKSSFTSETVSQLEAPHSSRTHGAALAGLSADGLPVLHRCFAMVVPSFALILMFSPPLGKAARRPFVRSRRREIACLRRHRMRFRKCAGSGAGER